MIYMSDLKLFRLVNEQAVEIGSASVALERSLQHIIERNMGVLFGVRLLASEFSTGIRHGGRMDSIGIDENGSPVIFEYKRAVNENVINQGLFYLDWLMDHRNDFWRLVLDRLGEEVAGIIDWTAPRLICVASGFTKYDAHAVQQMNRNIELVRYRDFGGELLALELMAGARTETKGVPSEARREDAPSRVVGALAQASEEIRDLFEAVDAYCSALGDDVTRKTLKHYFAFRRLQNFVCVEIHAQSATVLAFLKVDPESVELEDGFTRDVRSIGHFGTGDLEVRMRSLKDFERVRHLFDEAYDRS